ncbi:hypothetical protein [Hahella ganghwensis]|uniref:hypothetical protein n=1 Tax=Hahella ganghwensis TaxID=286420 RepID=UPI00039D5185|nr:hypothetical protein [Hahella ganghwensis]
MVLTEHVGFSRFETVLDDLAAYFSTHISFHLAIIRHIPIPGLTESLVRVKSLTVNQFGCRRVSTAGESSNAVASVSLLQMER